jgi:hypothetical protein
VPVPPSNRTLEGFTESERRRLSARVLSGKYFQIKTPVAEEYADVTCEAIEVMEHGVIVSGEPRVGKTMATRWMLYQLPQILGTSTPWLEVPVRALGSFDRDAFFSYLLELIRHRHQDGTTTAKRNRITRWLHARANRSGTATFILFLDEAHVLPVRAFRWLLEVDNELDRFGSRLFVLQVGQTDLLALRDRIAAQTNGDQFIERFMSVEFAYRGLKSESELHACLKNYAETKWPVNSGTSFAEYYIAQLVSRGYELQSVAPSMWQMFDDAWREGKQDGTTEVPMVYVSRGAVLLLNGLSDRYGDGPMTEPLPSDVTEAVDRCGFARYLARRCRAKSVAARASSAGGAKVIK